jgi:hypothetical protein
MRRAMLLSLAATVSFLMATVGVAHAEKKLVKSERYSLSFSIRQQDQTVAAPRMKVRVGENATMTVKDKATGRGYELTVLARPVAHPSGKAGEWLEVSAKYSELQQGSFVQKIQPVLVVPVETGAQAPSQAIDDNHSSMALVPSSGVQRMAALEGSGSQTGAELQIMVSAAPAEENGVSQTESTQESCESGFGGMSPKACRVCAWNPNYSICCTNSCCGEFTICGSWCCP